MKTVTQAFKNNIKLYGRELDSIISYDDNGDTVILGNAELNSVSPHYEGNILKSVMKQLDIDSNVDIPLNTEINYQFGVKVRTDNVVDYRDNYDYVDFGNYIVFKSEKQEDTGSYKLTCYDAMLNSMIDYEALQINYPINIREYISAICSYLNITFANSSDTFTNYDKPILNELYVDSDGKSLGYTFRDVLDELAEATASTICINEDNELEVRYITNTNDSIDEEYLKDINVNFGEQYGPINTVVLSRSSGTDKISDSIPSNLPDDEKIAIEIADNQIMNANNRDVFLPGILNRLYGLQYYINDYSSTGIVYYDLCDRYNVSIDNNNYSCVMLNDDIIITQGLVENVHTDMPEVSETDYTKTDKTDRKINQTNLIVDKQQGIIDSLVSSTVYISDSVSGIGTIQLDNAHEGQLYKLSISGQMSVLYPMSFAITTSGIRPYGAEILYPSSNLNLKSFNLMVDNVEYPLNCGFLNYLNTEIYDEIQYHNGEYKVIRRVGINSQGEKYALDEEIVELTQSIDIEVKANSIIKMKSFNNAILSATYLLENIYTDAFATEAYVQSEIKQTANEINAEVSQKVGNDEIIAKLNIAVEDRQGIIDIKGNQVKIQSDHFELDANGNMTCQNANVNGTITSSNGTIGGWAMSSDGLNNSNDVFIGNDGYTNIYTVVDLYILTAMLRGDVPWIPMPSSGTPEFERYDINNDGQINLQDLLLLRKKTLGDD